MLSGSARTPSRDPGAGRTRRGATMNRTCLPLALVAVVAAACSARAEKAALPPPTSAGRAVRVIHPAARIETGLARATGAIRAREDAVLSAKATGQIKRIRVQVGDRVKAGAVLVEMDATNAHIALENARAAGAARGGASRRRGARGSRAGRCCSTGREWRSRPSSRCRPAREIAAAQLDQARAAVHAAEQQVADALITAPFAGVVTGQVPERRRHGDAHADLAHRRPHRRGPPRGPARGAGGARAGHRGQARSWRA